MSAYLVAPDAVAVRMGLEGLDALADDRQESLLAVLRAVPIHLASYLRTKSFAEAEHVDTFHVEASEFSPGCGYGLKLALRNAFVDADEPLTVLLATTLGGLAQAQPAAAADMFVDYDLGAVHVYSGNSLLQGGFAMRTGFYFARVEYTAGFEAEPTQGVLLYQDTPDWLVEAATLLAMYAYKHGIDCDEATTADFIKACGLSSLLAARVRWIPDAVRPMER